MTCPTCLSTPSSVDGIHAIFVTDREIIETSHYSLWTCHCRDCLQPFLAWFVERIDWVGGNDRMWSGLAPISVEEAGGFTELAGRGYRAFSDFDLFEWRRGRLHLVMDPDDQIRWLNRRPEAGP